MTTRSRERPVEGLKNQPPNEGMKLSKPEYLGGSRPIRSGIIESGFAAYAQCWADGSRAMKAAVLMVALPVLPATLLVGPPVWEPPNLWPEAAVSEPTGSRDFMRKLRIGSYTVVLEDTPLRDVSSRFGAAIGRRGDAGEGLEWVCLQGHDPQGRWVLWLESGEVHGPTVGGVLLERLATDVHVDDRCTRLQGIPLSLPVPVSLGMSKPAVLHSLGQPTADADETLVYSSCHAINLSTEGRREPQPFDLCSSLLVAFKGGVVHAFQVWRTTTS
jgi:hypothetical protein